MTFLSVWAVRSLSWHFLCEHIFGSDKNTNGNTISGLSLSLSCSHSDLPLYLSTFHVPLGFALALATHRLSLSCPFCFVCHSVSSFRLNELLSTSTWPPFLLLSRLSFVHLGAQHEGPLRRTVRQETAALAAELQRKYQAVRSLEVRCWGLQNEPGQTPSTEVSSSRCLSVRRGHECVRLCVPGRVEVKSWGRCIVGTLNSALLL